MLYLKGREKPFALEGMEKSATYQTKPLEEKRRNSHTAENLLLTNRRCLFDHLTEGGVGGFGNN